MVLLFLVSVSDLNISLCKNFSMNCGLLDKKEELKGDRYVRLSWNREPELKQAFCEEFPGFYRRLTYTRNKRYKGTYLWVLELILKNKTKNNRIFFDIIYSFLPYFFQKEFFKMGHLQSTKSILFVFLKQSGNFDGFGGKTENSTYSTCFSYILAI